MFNALRDWVGFDIATIDDVIMGCGLGVGDHVMDIVCMVVLDVGWLLDVLGVMFNCFCGLV